jgi:hypothetical protein
LHTQKLSLGNNTVVHTVSRRKQTPSCRWAVAEGSISLATQRKVMHGQRDTAGPAADKGRESGDVNAGTNIEVDLHSHEEFKRSYRIQFRIEIMI